MSKLRKVLVCLPRLMLFVAFIMPVLQACRGAPEPTSIATAALDVTLKPSGAIPTPSQEEIIDLRWDTSPTAVIIRSSIPPTPRPIPPTPVPVSPTHTPEPPTVLSFAAEPTVVYPGEGIALTWRSSGGAKATILQRLPGDLLGESLSVPPNGSTLVTIEEHERYWHTFDLLVSNEAGQTDQRSLTLQIRCPYDYFFTPPPITSYGTVSCPYKPVAFSWAAEQVFEGGRMIWLQGVPAESTSSGVLQGPTIYVLYNSNAEGSTGWYEKFEDSWVSGEPESDPNIIPPEGLFQPIRGFGKLWRSDPEVRERLGWALAPEQGFESALQVGWRPYYSFGATYVRSLDGHVITLGVMGGWER